MRDGRQSRGCRTVAIATTGLSGGALAGFSHTIGRTGSNREAAAGSLHVPFSADILKFGTFYVNRPFCTTLAERIGPNILSVAARRFPYVSVVRSGSQPLAICAAKFLLL